MEKSKVNFWSLLIGFVIIYFGASLITNFINGIGNKYKENNSNYVYNDNVFSLITTPDNKVLEDIIKKYLNSNNFDVNIIYADNLEIVDKLNSGEKYDAIWASNSIWLDSLNGVSTSDSKSTSITPITFGIKKSKVFLVEHL